MPSWFVLFYRSKRLRSDVDVFGIRHRVESGSGRLKTRGGKTPVAGPIARLRPPIPAACLTRLRRRNTALWRQPVRVDGVTVPRAVFGAQVRLKLVEMLMVRVERGGAV